MFKKFKDKLAEEVKSSPQRIQQFAQAAQAAVTSASSSISDITNNELFSIGDNERQVNQTHEEKTLSQNTFQNVQLTKQNVNAFQENSNFMDFSSNSNETQRQRRLSNSSFASDVSFRLPSYESSAMYHLQSDMDVSASEADERGLSGGAVSLERVTKEQLYAAYKRTQERYTKYRSQYADLARHYKLLERENAKARSVLVETQDKALRRISELREQCSLEQSAKAHLEKALRVEIEEKTLKIETLNTKIDFLQNNDIALTNVHNLVQNVENTDDRYKIQNDQKQSDVDIDALHTKLEKMEQLVNKYKESFKAIKEKNAAMTSEIQILSNELENQKKENENLKTNITQLTEANLKIKQLDELNEELQNKVNTYDFNNVKELSNLELDLRQAHEEIAELKTKISFFNKREEEYAISLAENKLSIHKELESKEAEIRSLKDGLNSSTKEIQSLNIVLLDQKTNIRNLEEQLSQFKSEMSRYENLKKNLSDSECKIQELVNKCKSLGQSKAKSDEEYKCLQLQLKQETAEKLAMMDRNTYLEEKNAKLAEDILNRTAQINEQFNEITELKKKVKETLLMAQKEKDDEDVHIWKEKYRNLELEIQDERIELVKLQTEIEKLLVNHENVQKDNSEKLTLLNDLRTENENLLIKLSKFKSLETSRQKLINEVALLKNITNSCSQEARSLKDMQVKTIVQVNKQLNDLFANLDHINDINSLKNKNELLQNDYKRAQNEIKKLKSEYDSTYKKIELLQENNIVLQTELDYLKSRYVENSSIINERDELLIKIKEISDANKVLGKKAKDTESYCDGLIQKHNTIKQNLEESLTSMKRENYNSLEILSKVRCENDSLLSNYNEIKNAYDSCLSNLNDLKSRNLDLTTSEQKLQQDILLCNKSYSDNVKKFNQEKQSLVEQVQEYKNSTSSLTSEIKELKLENNSLLNDLSVISTKLKDSVKDIEEKQNYIHKLEEDIKDIKEKNVFMAKNCEEITVTLKSLKIEMDEIRKSHSLIETEKENLNQTIQLLETKQLTNKDLQKDTKQIQTDIVDAFNVCTQIDTPKSDCSIMTEICKLDLDDLGSIRNNYEIVKEDNKRLQSELEGLQTYLTNISKENSVLNDKLREYLATSETSVSKNEDATNFLAETQSLKCKIDDLVRENGLLVEENLELKDQLELQNRPKNDHITNDQSVDKKIYIEIDKFNDLINVKNRLESHVSNAELINKTIAADLEQQQTCNEKLKLSNEKLERRLDEALVSLRHLHNLQDNSELEYLRNILYEYLTGPGTHSLTLAKVIAAVVKFDDMQTQVVLQKEKERQGVLHQIGLL